MVITALSKLKTWQQQSGDQNLTKDPTPKVPKTITERAEGTTTPTQALNQK